jgi:hypothetical protein
MNRTIRKQIVFALEDDNEMMTAALDPGSDLDKENKRLNRLLIKRHKAILTKIEKGQALTQEDLVLIRDANEIHVNDVQNLNGRHRQAMALDEWLDNMIELSKEEAMKILETHLDKDTHTPVKVYRALHTLWEGATPDDVAMEPGFDEGGKCLKCGSKVSFADVTDTVVFVGDEIVKRYDGDITNRNCVRCKYPDQYHDFEHFDGDDP